MPQQEGPILLADSDDDNPSAANATHQKGKQRAAPELSESEEDDQPGTSVQHARQARAKRSAKQRNLDLEDGSEEEEEPVQPPKRQRRRPAVRAGAAVHEAAPDTQLVDEDDGKEEGGEVLEGSVERKRLRKANGAVVTAGGQGEAGRGALRTRTRSLPTRPNALERLQQHQVICLVFVSQASAWLQQCLMTGLSLNMMTDLSLEYVVSCLDILQPRKCG